ncbi:MAG: hypothetical protein AB8B59_09015 [Maribacter sp.]
MKKLLKIIFKIFGGLLLIGLIAFGILYAVYNESLPEGKSGPAADALAEKVLKSINYDAYKNTRYLEWTFAGGAHQYKWDKVRGIVEVKWDDYQVILNMKNASKSDVWNNGIEVFGNGRQKLIKKATDFFNNDSFWLVAPFKVFDEGTERSIVKLEDGSDALLITYTEGGTTPGDSYLWKLQPSGFPESFRMWVGIIPIGGLEATWDDWKIMESGVFLPASHKMGPVTLFMSDVSAYN